ncbi:MAG TPA: hypothetical protein VGG19_15035 [Tepidisphaeraceae bacterium]|jgi:hypothetical protein
MKYFTKILWLTTLLFIAAAGLWMYQDQFFAARKLAKLEAEKHELEQVVQRLSAEKRVADCLVKKQWTDHGVLQTQVLFVEYARDGEPLPAREFTLSGKMVHIDAMVIKFDRDYVKSGDALRGHSIALFARIYGDHQTPADAPVIDAPDQIPAFYRGASSESSKFETDLWHNFWKLVDDENYRKQQGVRIAQGEAVWLPFQPDRLYTITLESAGGLNMTSQPIKGIYQAALHQS